MNARPSLLVAALFVAALAVGAALASEPVPSSTPETAQTWLPPDTSSKKPDAAEWEKATPLALPRKHCNEPMADGSCRSTCSAKVLREWVEVRCRRAASAEVLMGVRVLSGPSDDVTLVDPPEEKPGDKGQRGFALVFPMRRGERRTMEVAAMLPLMFRAWTVEEELELVVSAMWLPNARRPVVTVY